jgi:hypothetical protein
MSWKPPADEGEHPMKCPLLAAAFVLQCACAAPLHAHHGVAAYDMTTPSILKGTVREFDWSNPHATIHIDAPDDKGVMRKWEVETNSPNLLNRAGWNKETIKPGAQMAIHGFKGKDNAPTMRMEKIVLPDGREITPANVNANTR